MCPCFVSYRALLSTEYIKLRGYCLALVKVFLVSSECVSAALLNIFKWRSSPQHLEKHLDQLVQLPGEEVVKHLQDILDSLFSMFSAENGHRVSMAHSVYNALVHIFCLLESHRFQQFQPVFDAYISNHFSAILVSK